MPDEDYYENIKLPQQLKDQEAKADAYEKALTAESQAAATAVLERPPLLVADGNTIPAPVLENTIKPALAPENTIQALPEATPSKNYEEQYLILKGKYDAEVPRLAKERRELRRKMSELESQIEQLTSQLTTNPVNTVGDTQPGKANIKELPEYLTEEEREELGSDIYAPVAKMTEGYVNNFLEQRLKPLQEKVNSIEHRKDDDAFETFKSEVDVAVQGDWERINRNDDFCDWLDDTSDPGSGLSYKELLNINWEKRNVKKVAEFFNKFIAKIDGVAETKLEVPAEQVQPSTIRADSSSSQLNAKRTYYASELQQFATDLSKQKYTPEQADQIQRQFDVAQAEGRLLPG